MNSRALTVVSLQVVGYDYYHDERGVVAYRLHVQVQRRGQNDRRASFCTERRNQSKSKVA